MKKLDGKVAYVTGAGNGIGRAVALKLASEGAKLVINDLEENPAIAVAEEISNDGGEAVTVVGSVTATDFGDRFIQAGLDQFGAVDIIVNNAGYTWDSMIHSMTDEQYDAMLDVHLKAPFRIARAAAAFIRPAARREAEDGREVFRKIVNISSVAGTGGNIGQANYSAAKSGVIGLTKTMAKEWARLKVNVNCVAFGLIDTRLTEATDEKKTINVNGNEIAVGIPTKIADGIKATIPMGRAGTPAEAAGGVYLFCTPESNYITGQTLIVGGGAVL
ncbi:SDR family NAD(P)-dependent oxidoreductase [Hwanghaeella grinnelliae]|uniref:SDR family NAD(P)-dependent oxidoreductase n=1 Tax=Hwanghaeella grinnelliae TaxID=2500179 RepID=A0A437QV55_9PROT|nr:SDR family NAD(P)-dependent oxidoreductase [Hwanghaeella grinnelliae]RVU38378.1 SDR family NAD(P)-dependent oxidoreductase [Hwanghaeella grinnelliae]